MSLLFHEGSPTIRRRATPLVLAMLSTAALFGYHAEPTQEPPKICPPGTIPGLTSNPDPALSRLGLPCIEDMRRPAFPPVMDALRGGQKVDPSE